MSTNEENNKSQEENNSKQKIIKTNETVEIPPLTKKSEKNLSKKNSDLDKSNKSKENEENQNLNKSEKPLTDGVNQENKENKEENNTNNDINNEQNNENNNDDLTNIKFVTKEKLGEFEKSQEKEINQQINYNNNSPNKLISIKDLQQNPKEKLIINSPKSLKALYDSGYSLKQLYYKTFEEFLSEHKDVMHLDEGARNNRYHFYEKLRLDKINSLVQYREQLIEEEIFLKQNKEINEENKINNEIKPMKFIILDNDKRIAKEEIDIIKKKHDKELANIVQLELDKDLFNLEMIKQENNYQKEYQKLNFMNFNNNIETNTQNEDFEKNDQYPPSLEEPINTYVSLSSNILNKNYKSLSLPKSPKNLDLNENTYLDNLYSLQQTLVNQKYEKNQKKITQKLERLEKVRKITGEQRALKKRIGVERAAQNLQKNAIDFKKKHENLIKEIQNKKLNIYQNKKKFENLIKIKNEINNLKYLGKLDYISDMKHQDENIRTLKYLEFLEKRSKIDKIKNDRLNIIDKKLQRIEYLNSERQKNIDKIKKILNKGINEENLEKIKQKFPSNQDINKVINNYKNQKEKIIKNELKTSQSINKKKRPKSQGKIYLKNLIKKNNDEIRDIHEINNKKTHKLYNIDYKEKNKALTETNKISNESEIKDKVRLYRNLVYKQFYKKVEEEKLNEEMRIKELERIEDKNKKYQLEKKFRKDRALAYMRLERENQKINDKINIYEFNLKNNL